MAFDSLVRLRQLNTGEVGDFVLSLIGRQITGFVLTGTGILTGQFYPLNSNPSGYLTGVNTGEFVTNSSLAVSQNNVAAIASGLYYLKTNPSGFIAKTTADTNYIQVYPFSNSGVKFIDDPSSTTVFSFLEGSHFYIQSHGGASIIDVSGTNYGGRPTISGFAIHSTGIKVNGKDVLTDSGAWVSTVNDSSNTRLFLYDGIIVDNPFVFKQNSGFYLRGYNGYSIIDLYDSTRFGNKPYISGFEMDVTKLSISGILVNFANLTGTGAAFTGATLANLASVSGALHTTDLDLYAADQTLRANLVITGSKIGPPTSTPTILYLTLDATAYSGKLYTAFSSVSSLIQYITGNSIKNSLVYVGTGYFGAKTIGGGYDFGNIMFQSLYDYPRSGQIDFTFANSTGNIYTSNGANINYTIEAGSIINHKNYGGYSASTITSSSLGSGFFDGLDNVTIVESATNGNLTVTNSNIISLTAANYRSLILEKCIVNNVSATTNLANTGITFTNCLLSGSTQLPITSGRSPFIVFNNCGKDFSYNRSLYLTGGALGFDSQNLWLARTNTGNLDTQMLLTKNSGDILYYDIGNSQGYVNQNFLATYYAQLTEAVLLNNTTHNTNLYLRDNTHSLNPFYFNGSTDFYLVATGGAQQAILDVYGSTNIIGSLYNPYLSGFIISSPKITTASLYATENSTYISNVLIRDYITGVVNVQTGGQFVPFVIGAYSVPTGEVSTGFISFGYTFATIPKVIGNFVNDSGDPIMLYDISGISTTGFFLNCSDTVATNNYKFDYLATTGDSYMTLFNGIMVSIYQNTGLLTGVFYPLFTNPSGYVMNNQTGIFATTGSLSSTGSLLQSQVNSITAWTGYTPTIYASISHTHGVTGLTTSGALPITGLVTITGIGGLSVIFAGNTINFSGGAGGSANTGELTGVFYPLTGNPSGFLRTATLSDQIYLQVRYLV